MAEESEAEEEMLHLTKTSESGESKTGESGEKREERVAKEKMSAGKGQIDSGLSHYMRSSSS